MLYLSGILRFLVIVDVSCTWRGLCREVYVCMYVCHVVMIAPNYVLQHAFGPRAAGVGLLLSAIF